MVEDIERRRGDPRAARSPSSDGGVGARVSAVRDDARDLADSLSDAARALSREIVAQVRERPYASLAVAAAAGWVLGGGLPTRLTRFGAGLALRLALVHGLASFGEGFDEDVGPGPPAMGE